MKQIDASIPIGVIVDTAKLLVEYPNEIKAHKAAGVVSAAVSLSCHRQDTKKLIGAAGSMHKALYAIARQMGAVAGYQLEYERVMEPEIPALAIPVGGQRAFVSRPNWPQEAIASVIERMATEMFGGNRVVRFVNGDNSTVIEILIPAGTLDPQVRVDLQEALGKIWHAIGRAQGRMITVKLAETFDLEVEAQPRTADGRYVKERRR